MLWREAGGRAHRWELAGIYMTEATPTGTFYITQGGRLVFEVEPVAGALTGSAKKTERVLQCGFARGRSLWPQTEELILQVAERSRDWTNFVFKLKLDGFKVEPGGPLKLPFPKL